MIAAVAVDGLAVRRGERRLFEALSLQLHAGEAVALTGPNGAGKTSLLRALAGFLRPEAGTIEFRGADGALDADDARREALHLVGHQDGLKASRSARDELLFQARWAGADDTAALAAAETLGLSRLLGLAVRHLSAGQRRRLALARLIASPRDLWLLDEPLAPLDAEHRRQFGELMAAHLGRGGLVLAAVHDPLPIPARSLALDGAPGRVKALAILFRRELALAWSGGGGPLLALGFFAAVTTLIPLSGDAAPTRLAAIGTGVVWVALALASLLSLERMFERDFEDGALDLIALGPASLESACAVKCLAHWAAAGAPLALAAPIAAASLGAPLALWPLIFATAAIGGVAFAFVGGLGAALAMGSRRGGLIIAVIVLPLLAAPVIFGGGALSAFAAALPWHEGLLFLAAYALGAAALCPFAMAAACRSALA